MSSRLQPLLEWINVDREAEEWREENVEEYRPVIPKREMERRLVAFVKSFDVEIVTWPQRLRTVDQLDVLRFQVTHLLLGRPPAVAVRSLALQVRWGVVYGRGENTMVVSGTVPDLVLFLVARLMVDERVELDTCEAPAPALPGRRVRDWSKWSMCGNVYIVTGRGNKKRYCSAACKARAKNPKWRQR